MRSIIPCLAGLATLVGTAGAGDGAKDLWVARPVIRPEVPAGRTDSPNPIDAFLARGAAGRRGEAGRPGRSGHAPPPGDAQT